MIIVFLLKNVNRHFKWSWCNPAQTQCNEMTTNFRSKTCIINYFKNQNHFLLLGRQLKWIFRLWVNIYREATGVSGGGRSWASIYPRHFPFDLFWCGVLTPVDLISFGRLESVQFWWKKAPGRLFKKDTTSQVPIIPIHFSQVQYIR